MYNIIFFFLFMTAQVFGEGELPISEPPGGDVPPGELPGRHPEEHEPPPVQEPYTPVPVEHQEPPAKPGGDVSTYSLPTLNQMEYIADTVNLSAAQDIVGRLKSGTYTADDINKLLAAVCTKSDLEPSMLDAVKSSIELLLKQGIPEKSFVLSTGVRLTSADIKLMLYEIRAVIDIKILRATAQSRVSAIVQKLKKINVLQFQKDPGKASPDTIVQIHTLYKELKSLRDELKLYADLVSGKETLENIQKTSLGRALYVLAEVSHPDTRQDNFELLLLGKTKEDIEDWVDTTAGLIPSAELEFLEDQFATDSTWNNIAELYEVPTFAELQKIEAQAPSSTAILLDDPVQLKELLAIVSVRDLSTQELGNIIENVTQELENITAPDKKLRLNQILGVAEARKLLKQAKTEMDTLRQELVRLQPMVSKYTDNPVMAPLDVILAARAFYQKFAVLDNGLAAYSLFLTESFNFVSLPQSYETDLGQYFARIEGLSPKVYKQSVSLLMFGRTVSDVEGEVTKDRNGLSVLTQEKSFSLVKEQLAETGSWNLIARAYDDLQSATQFLSGKHAPLGMITQFFHYIFDSITAFFSARGVGVTITNQVMRELEAVQKELAQRTISSRISTDSPLRKKIKDAVEKIDNALNVLLQQVVVVGDDVVPLKSAIGSIRDDLNAIDQAST